MSFNPNAERFSLNQLRNMAIRTDPTLKMDLEICLQRKAVAEETYLLRSKTGSDQYTFDGKMKQIHEWIDSIDRRAYRDIIHNYLAKPPAMLGD